MIKTCAAVAAGPLRHEQEKQHESCMEMLERLTSKNMLRHGRSETQGGSLSKNHGK